MWRGNVRIYAGWHRAAAELAVAAGTHRETVEIIEVEDVPLAYYQGNTNRVKVKAAGDLK